MGNVIQKRWRYARQGSNGRCEREYLWEATPQNETLRACRWVWQVLFGKNSWLFITFMWSFGLVEGLYSIQCIPVISVWIRVRRCLGTPINSISYTTHGVDLWYEYMNYQMFYGLIYFIHFSGSCRGISSIICDGKGLSRCCWKWSSGRESIF